MEEAHKARNKNAYLVCSGRLERALAIASVN
jgi:hypothetical protein